MASSSSLSPALQAAKAALQAQVKSGAITQAQADAELNRQKTLESQPLSPALQQAQANLARQVQAGGITQAQADAELSRLKGLPNDQVNAGNQAAQFPSPSSPLPQAFGQSPVNGNTPLNNPGQIGQAQYGLNQQNVSDQLQVNRVDELSPFGTSQYVQGPDGNQIKVQSIGNVDPRTTAGWTGEQFQNQSYIDRALQAIAGEGGANNQGQAGLLPQLRGMFSSALDFSKVSAAPNANTFANDQQSAQDKVYKAFASRNDPIFARQNEDFEQMMANRGIPVGSQAYNEAKTALLNQQGDLRNQAIAQSVPLGQNQQAMDFGNAVTAHQIGTSDAQTLRNQPLTDLRGLLSAVNPLQMPQFNQTANVNVPVTDIAGLADQGLNRENNLAGIKLGGMNAMALQKLQGSQALQQQQQGYQNQQGLLAQQNSYNQANQPSSNGFLGNLAGGFLGGIFGGAGQSIGSSIGGWF